MIIKAFAVQPLIVADEKSVITFGEARAPAKVYDFDFVSFADENFVCEGAQVEKICADALGDKISTYDEDDEINVLISLMKVPAKGQRRNSSAQSHHCQLEYVGMKRNCSDFHSQACDDENVDFSGHNAYASDKLSHRNINLLDDSIDEAIVNKNLSAVSFDGDIVHDMAGRCLSHRGSHSLRSKRVKQVLDC